MIDFDLIEKQAEIMLYYILNNLFTLGFKGKLKNDFPSISVKR
jgi:hypothetical protein